MIRKEINITFNRIKFYKVGPYLYLFSKNDLPAKMYNIRNFEFEYNMQWFNNGFRHRCDDLLSYLYLSKTAHNIYYDKYDRYHKYNGYAMLDTHTIYKYYKFIRGICLEFLKEELESDD